MIRTALILILAAISAIAGAQNAVINYQEMEYDFGEINELGGVVTHRFVYTNTGSVPLILKSVHTSCGCTSPAWSKEPVLPQKSGYIDVTFDPRDRVGSFTKSIIVNSNATEQSQTLYISGTVTPRPEPLSSQYPYTMYDLRLKTTTVNFGKMTNSQTASQNIEVANTSKADILIESDPESPHSKYISITAKPSVLKPGQKGTITCQINTANCPYFDIQQFEVPVLINTYKYHLHVKTTITEQYSDSQRASQPGMEIINPGDLSIGTIREGETRIISLRYHNTGVSPLIIRAIRNACDCISYNIITPEVAPDSDGEVKIVFNSEGKKGAQTRYLTIVANIPDKPLTVLKLTADISTN